MIARVVTPRARPRRIRCDIVSLARAFVARHRALARSARAFARRRPLPPDSPALPGSPPRPDRGVGRPRRAAPAPATNRGRISGIRC